VFLHPISDFIDSGYSPPSDLPTYWYEGYCFKQGVWLRLPRTAFVEAIARGLMTHLAQSEYASHEGKMYGVLLVETLAGEHYVLKAFSGLLLGKSQIEGWVPPIPGRDRVALAEANVLAELATIKKDLITLQQLPERQEYERLVCNYKQQLQMLAIAHRQRKEQRHQQRQTLLTTLNGDELITALNQLDSESRQDGIERRRLKQQRDHDLTPLKSKIDQADGRIQALKHHRKILSQQLQLQLHAVYSLTNFEGASVSLQALIDDSLPTGTGECCAPKLLNYAAIHRLKPLAMAEFWWGPSPANGSKRSGEFYGACAERCQPLMGFLLSGLSSRAAIAPTTDLPILYEDDCLIAVNKPAGLLSVPGRYRDRQDCLHYRLQQHYSGFLKPLHRLDQETSGVLLFARDLQTHRSLSQQWQQRQVHKVYEAIVPGDVSVTQGMIELPLWGNPAERPRQSVDWHHGKPSTTQFRVLAKAGNDTRLELIPLTGRTHQLRVHAAHPQGLGVAILGDRLYGCQMAANRLHLHARLLCVYHPRSGQLLQIQAQLPF
jgi:tRNA pseudouridine32 synthase/23S rRNA pseudouridine746 synthase